MNIHFFDLNTVDSTAQRLFWVSSTAVLLTTHLPLMCGSVRIDLTKISFPSYSYDGKIVQLRSLQPLDLLLA